MQSDSALSPHRSAAAPLRFSTLTPRPHALGDVGGRARDLAHHLTESDRLHPPHVRGAPRHLLGGALSQGSGPGQLARPDQARPQPGETLAKLRALAIDGSEPDGQGIALAAIGFSGEAEVMPTILQGAQLGDPFLVDRALLGLAVLRAPTTPPGIFEAVMLRPGHPDDGRVQAAWALHRIQQTVTNQEPVLAVWRKLLRDHRDELPAGVLANAVRGIGYGRAAADGALAGSYLKHPVPRVRMAATIAVGRIKAQDQWPLLVDLLAPQETVQNVRLHARKALQELAGGTDHGYDVAAWRKTFDRGER